MAHDDSDWRVPVGANHSATFPLARYLEYTDSSLEQKLKPVSVTSLEYLSKIPTLFMSELQIDRAGGNREYVTVRVGWVWNLNVEGKDIRYWFRIDFDFGSVIINDRAGWENVVGLGRWELSRTHWAVKQGDLFELLQRAGLNLAAGGDAAPAHAPPAPLPENQGPALPIIGSLQDYLNFVLSLENRVDGEIFYRGHSDRRYRLEPSLFRKNAAGEYRYRQREETLVREVLTAQATEFSNDQYMLDRLVRMQHYGLPTRLLDVTSNPLVALYFCCSDPKYDGEGNEIDGEVIILTTKKSDVLFFDSDTVSCIANLCLLTDEEKNRMNTASPMDTFNQTVECKKLLHFIRREKPYFEDRIVPSDLEKIVFVRGRNTNERITSQSGAFLMFGKDSVLPETGYSSLNVTRIAIRQKASILAQLAKLNIKSSTIYPGIEKATAEIAKKHELIA
ncbi:FRG domain-containing protein [Sinorhizobium meliloti]|nr:FRG domain-containing protein [Sinorhizobium meliloti]